MAMDSRIGWYLSRGPGIPKELELSGCRTSQKGRTRSDDRLGSPRRTELTMFGVKVIEQQSYRLASLEPRHAFHIYRPPCPQLSALNAWQHTQTSALAFEIFNSLPDEPYLCEPVGLSSIPMPAAISTHLRAFSLPPALAMEPREIGYKERALSMATRTATVHRAAESGRMGENMSV
ncbi:hypothetical protein BJ508DRAFT_77859 [Ascobolus immersus RN42]|uniref:Uncharacterized protein n=1 Tax=Ascobolus immersus RN42 TaxID=1160509 RepID=A0A3N4IAC3_ASCIM|nr:hypothetical protein BJ508DRAFT_77859 [Ascobolus immersus RN42]